MCSVHSSIRKATYIFSSVGRCVRLWGVATRIRTQVVEYRMCMTIYYYNMMGIFWSTYGAISLQNDWISIFISKILFVIVIEICIESVLQTQKQMKEERTTYIFCELIFAAYVSEVIAEKTTKSKKKFSAPCLLGEANVGFTFATALK